MRTRADVRRLLALAPDGEAGGLHAALAPLAPAGAADRLRDYLFDRAARPLAPDLTGPLFAPVPGGVAPLDERIAAILGAPAVAFTDEVLPLALLRYRFSPRADDLVALAVAHQPLPMQPGLLAQLAVDLGPDPDVLALSAVQCGRVLAWAPHLLEWPIAEEIVAGLLALLVAERPEPLLAQVARALAPLAPRGGPLPALIRARARELVGAAPPLARAGAYVLGFAEDPAGGMVETFLDGLVAAANVPRVADLVAAALHEGDEVAALALAARLPLDPLAPALRAALDDPELAPLAAHALVLIDGAEDAALPPMPPEPPVVDPRDDATLHAQLADPALRDDAWCALRDRARRS